jgi:hypothetical protein
MYQNYVNNNNEQLAKLRSTYGDENLNEEEQNIIDKLENNNKVYTDRIIKIDKENAKLFTKKSIDESISETKKLDDLLTKKNQDNYKNTTRKRIINAKTEDELTKISEEVRDSGLNKEDIKSLNNEIAISKQKIKQTPSETKQEVKQEVKREVKVETPIQPVDEQVSETSSETELKTFDTLVDEYTNFISIIKNNIGKYNVFTREGEFGLEQLLKEKKRL